MQNKIKARKLLDIEFKTIIIRKINELTGNYQKLQGSYNSLSMNYTSMKRT